MSSNCIYIQCGKCQKTEIAYTGSIDVEQFENRSWEGEFVTTICDDCEGENK